MNKTRVAIVGATGLVGLEMLKILKERPEGALFEPVLFASTARPEEKVLDLAQSMGILRECPYVLGAATNDIARLVRENLKPEQVFIDNSSAFRLDPDVPLVVPEVNGDFVQSGAQVFANPNCTAILLCIALNAFKEVGFMRVVVSTYQAASGAGLKGLEELDAQIKAVGTGQPVPKSSVFPHQLAQNVLSHNTAIRPVPEMGAGYNDEEWKVIEESRKILDQRHLMISATCIRVPVRRAHTEAVTIDFKNEISLEKARELLAKAPGVKVVDNWEANHFPMPLEAQDQDLVLVGRVRRDPSLAKTIHLILAGDQIRKGAATNALQIMFAHREWAQGQKGSGQA